MMQNTNMDQIPVLSTTAFESLWVSNPQCDWCRGATKMLKKEQV